MVDRMGAGYLRIAVGSEANTDIGPAALRCRVQPDPSVLPLLPRFIATLPAPGVHEATMTALQVLQVPSRGSWRSTREAHIRPRCHW